METGGNFHIQFTKSSFEKAKVLTYMATLGELCERNQLVSIGGGLEPGEQPLRLLYASHDAVDWLERVLPALDPVLDEGFQSPIEQVDDLFHDYVSGADMSFYARSHSMHPTGEGIWELKTPDVRFFGWFAGPCQFVIGYADTAARCKEHGLYAGYRDQTKRFRDQLDLDEPKFISGDYVNVL